MTGATVQILIFPTIVMTVFVFNSCYSRCCQQNSSNLFTQILENIYETRALPGIGRRGGRRRFRWSAGRWGGVGAAPGRGCAGEAPGGDDDEARSGAAEDDEVGAARGLGQGGVGAAPGDELALARRGTRVLRGRHGVPGRGGRRRRAAAHAGEGRPGTGAAANVDLNFVKCGREGIYGGSARLVPANNTSRH